MVGGPLFEKHCCRPFIHSMPFYKYLRYGRRSYYLSMRKTLEFNVRHPLVRRLKQRFEAEGGPQDDATRRLATVLCETAALRSGYALEDTAGYAGRLEHMVARGLNLNPDEPVFSAAVASVGFVKKSGWVEKPMPD